MRKGIYIPFYYSKIPKEAWVSFVRFIERHNDFYQLLALSEFIEARLQKIKPEKVDLSDRMTRKKLQNLADPL